MMGIGGRVGDFGMFRRFLPVWAFCCLLLLPGLRAVGQQDSSEEVFGDMGIALRDAMLRRVGLGLHHLLDSVSGDTLQVESSYRYRSGSEGMRAPYEGHSLRGYSLRAYGAAVRPFSVWGSARYARNVAFGQWGSLMADPSLFYPYLLADTSRRRVEHESYGLQGYMGMSLLRTMALGVGGEFVGSNHYGLADPRPRSRVGDLRVYLSWSVWMGRGGRLSVEGRFRRYSETLGVRIERDRRADYFYRLLGHGLYDRLVSETKSSIGQENYLYGWEGMAQWRWRESVLLFASYRGQRGHGEELQVARLSQTDQHGVEVGGELRRRALGWHWQADASYMEVQRVGTEIYYDTVSVSITPRIQEFVPFAYVPKWMGAHRSLRLGVSGDREFAGWGFRARSTTQYGWYRSLYAEPRREFGMRMLVQHLQLDARVQVGRGVEVGVHLGGGVRLADAGEGGAIGGGAFPTRAYDALIAQLGSSLWGAEPGVSLRLGESLTRYGGWTASVLYRHWERVGGEGRERGLYLSLQYDL